MLDNLFLYGKMKIRSVAEAELRTPFTDGDARWWMVKATATLLTFKMKRDVKQAKSNMEKSIANTMKLLSNIASKNSETTDNGPPRTPSDPQISPPYRPSVTPGALDRTGPLYSESPIYDMNGPHPYFTMQMGGADNTVMMAAHRIQDFPMDKSNVK